MDICNRPLDVADLSAAPVVAQASGARPGRTNWTVLTIYQTDQHPNLPEPSPYIAEIVGETTQAGQVRRCKRKGFPTLAKALNWIQFDPHSPLYRELRQKVLEGIDSPGVRFVVQRAGGGEDCDMGQGSREQSFGGDALRQRVARNGFAAPSTNPLGAALCWLYPSDDRHRLLGDVVAMFCADFGIARDTVDYALYYEAGRCNDHEQPHPGNLEWIKAFVASLRFFDREAFHANRI